MSSPDGLVVILPADADGPPLWWRVIDGSVVSRSAMAAMTGGEGDAAVRLPVMLVVPQSAVTMRRVDLPADMPPAQARAVAPRMAREASIGEADGLHAVPCVDDPATVAIIARDDIAHFIAWAHRQGIEPDVILPAATILPEPEEGYVAADMGGMKPLRGQGLFADIHDGWTEALAGNGPARRLDAAEVDAAIIAALAAPPVNLRSGEFARPRESGIDADWLKRMAIWIGFIALASLFISLALIAKYHVSAARLDAKAVEVARTVLPAANDAVLAVEELDAMLAQRGGGYSFTGPVAGLMVAMQSAPGVSLSTLDLGDDGLVHATLASPRAEDINTVLIAVQAAGFRITATSSADSGGRVVADITVKP